MNGSVKCTECGGSRYIPMGGNTYRCEYCGTMFSVTASGSACPPPPRPLPPVQPAYDAQPYQAPTQYRSHKDKVTALVITFFFGFFGIQWFYLGRTGMGIFSILFFWTWIPGIISFVQFLILLFMSSDEFDRKYNM